MVDFSRYKGVVLMCAYLGGIAASLDGALTLTLGHAPSWLVFRVVPLGWKEVEKADQRVADLLEERERDGGVLKKPLCIYLGLSSARVGIDPSILAAESGTQMYYVGLCGSGGAMEHVLKLARPWLRSDVKPTLVILAMHTCWLGGERLDRSSVRPASIHWWSKLRFRVQSDLRNSWITSHQLDVNHFFRSCLYDAREWLFVKWRLRLAAFSPPDSDPWRTRTNPYYSESRGPDFRRTQMAEWEAIGWFDPQQYLNQENKQPGALVEFLSKCMDRDARVVIVLLPERSNLRARVPPEADQLFAESIHDVAAGPNVVVWDARDTINDELFRDNCHLEWTGREELSHLLAEKIRTMNLPGVSER